MKILDVGGAKKTYEKATHVVDIVKKPTGFDKEYIRFDICSGKWPYPDKYFDFVYCSNVLEDIRDPSFACKEMSRIGKAGAILVPNPLVELKFNIDSWPGKEKYTGFCHHRWIVIPKDQGLIFLPKWSMTNSYDWVPNLSEEELWSKFCLQFNWTGAVKHKEIMMITWPEYYDVLKELTGTDPDPELNKKIKQLLD